MNKNNYVGSLRDQSVLKNIQDELLRLGIHTVIHHENDFTHLFVEDTSRIEQARDVYRVYIGGRRPIKANKDWEYVQGLKMGPVSIIILVACILVFVFGWIMKNEELYRLLLFTTSKSDPLFNISRGEYWRTITPAFVHFGYIHVFFNLLWWKELGKLIESTKGGLFLIILFLVTGISSNYMQAIMDSAPFGGLSGVVYGLLGFIWPYSRINKNFKFSLPKSDITLMLVWLVLGFFDVFNFKMANWAHGIGLLSGVVLGVIFGFVDQKKSADQ